MAERAFLPANGCPRGCVLLGGQFVVGSAGAITSQTGDQDSGGVIAYVANGLYTVTFGKTYTANLCIGVDMTGPDAAPFPTTTGSQPQTRVKTASGFKIQFVRPDTQVDTDPASGTLCNWMAIVKN